MNDTKVSDARGSGLKNVFSTACFAEVVHNAIPVRPAPIAIAYARSIIELVCERVTTKRFPEKREAPEKLSR